MHDLRGCQIKVRIAVTIKYKVKLSGATTCEAHPPTGQPSTYKGVSATLRADPPFMAGQCKTKPLLLKPALGSDPAWREDKTDLIGNWRL